MSTSSTSSLGNYQSQKPGTYTAETDGFVVGYTSLPSTDGVTSFARIYCTINSDIVVGASGGRTVYGNDNQAGIAPASFTAPVPAGSTYVLSVDYPDSNESDPPVYFYWIPLN